jgi:hypothetical protein
MNDDTIAIIRRDSFTLKTIENKIEIPYIHELDMSLESLEKGGFLISCLRKFLNNEQRQRYLSRETESGKRRNQAGRNS